MCKHTENCIAKDKLCDGNWDCYDGSDEDIRGVCAGNFTCGQGEFRCDSMTCIPEYLVCDGRADCEDRSDEKWTVCRDRVQNCANGTFPCAVTKQCLPDTWRCDGRVDCPDRSDEKNCEAHDCSVDEFQCLTGQCIPLHWVCDGRANCRDGSDEMHCHEVGGAWVPCSTRYCRKLNEYLCKREQRCIRRSAVCDGIEDCSDGQDERKCSEHRHLECDGVTDCTDGSDEHEHCCEFSNILTKPLTAAHCRQLSPNVAYCRVMSFCISYNNGHYRFIDSFRIPAFDAKIVEARCRAPDITCRTFTGIVCLPAAKICDGVPDCFDAKDEEFCGYEEQQ
ncbi:unnamed protein product [Cylicostephanus goldi]|uniref:Uncharacterized protein n=1 Tax=Cylicostephanus goldi TaxID=71465 RepID=A0A3P7N3B6_CYLGO|nr:unnamed protein product [Cylicostephanus goldi]